MKNSKLKIIFGIFFSFIFCTSSAYAVSFNEIAEKKPTGFVSDFAEIITNDFSIEQKLQVLEKSTTGEMAVVTIDQLSTNHTIETFATELFRTWGIGKKEKNNGVLLLISRDDRKFKVETGYGVEGILPDILANRIVQTYLVPHSKAGNYDTGILQTVNAIEQVFLGNADEIRAARTSPKPFPEWFLFVAIVWIIVWKNFKNPIQGTALIAGIPAAFWIAGGFGIFLYVLILLFSFLKGNGGNGNFGGGGFSGGSGFGGFGGGMSGGGGVSGSW